MKHTFYGLAKKWLQCDRYYKFHVANETLLGTKVGGQFFDKLSVRVQLWWLYLTFIGIPFVELIATWAENRCLRLEKEAEDDLGLAAQRDESLVIPISDIRNVRLASRRDWWTIWINAGTIRIECRNHADIELVITGRQDHEGIAALFREQGITVEQ